MTECGCTCVYACEWGMCTSARERLGVRLCVRLSVREMECVSVSATAWGECLIPPHFTAFLKKHLFRPSPSVSRPKGERQTPS